MAASQQPPADAALAGPWAVYRTWAATARYQKAAIDYWNRWNLKLVIAGAVLAAVGQQITSLAPQQGPLAMLYRAPSVVGAALIALAAYFTSQVMAGNRDKLWIRCRAAAESLKSEIYLYRAAVAPFDGADRGKQLNDRVEKILQELKDIEPRQPAAETAPPLNPLTVDAYIAERVDDQIRWYKQRAGEFQAASGQYRNWVFVLGALSVLLGLASSFEPISVWIAVIASVTGALTAHTKNQRYQELTAMYSTTALRLQLLQSEWAGSQKTEADKPERDAFIRRCEETMALENGAWLALWSQPRSKQSSGNAAKD